MSREANAEIEAKAAAFLESRKNANNLIDIINILENKKDNFKKCIQALERIFSDVLQKREMFSSKEVDQDRTSAEKKYCTWLRENYENTFERLVFIMEEAKSGSQAQAISTMMKLLELEGKFPLELNKNDGYQFPSHRLEKIVLALLSSLKPMKNQITVFGEFAHYQDVLYFAWKLLVPNILKTKKPSEMFILNFLDLVDKIALPKSFDSTLLLCGDANDISDEPVFVLNEDHVRKWTNKTWICVVKWEHTPATHKKLIVVLLEKILIHLKRPLYLTDYLMDSLGMGGAVSVLALQGMLTLIQNYNLDYPNIYGKLYTMIEPDIFHMKYKPRLFYLSDLFLTSSHLPQQLVAAFVKRMARLCLVAPPQDIQIMLAFIGNLLIRHPGLKKLLVGSATDPEMAGDPYDMDEKDPTKSRAIDSFLWEIYNLKRHYLPSISNAAMQLVSCPLPAVEWNISQLLENTQNDIFDNEIKKKPKEISLTYDKPQTMRLPQGEKLLQFWTLQ